MKRRMISLMMAVVLILAMLPPNINVLANNYGTDDYRQWAQGDPRWGQIKLGTSSDTVAKSGCLVTAVTKLVIQAGLMQSEKFNISTMVNLMNDHGGFTSSGSMYWAKPAACVSGFGAHGFLLNSGTYSSSEYNAQLLSWIQKGYHLVLGVKGQGHYVAVDEAMSLRTGTIHIMDSLTSGANADIILGSRYSSFNLVYAYTGGVTQLGYIHKCTSLPSSGTAEVIKSTNLKSLPCSADTDQNSQTVYSPSIGSVFTVTGLYKNTADNYWYEIEYEGKTCYVYSGDVEYTATDFGSVTISDVVAPSQITQGNKFSIGGTVSSSKLPLFQVGAYLYSGPENNGNPFVISEDNSIDGKTYELKKSNVDLGIKFAELSPGTYTYLLTAVLRGYYTDGNVLKSTANRVFGLYECTFTVSSSGGGTPVIDPLRVTCSDFSPADQAVLEKKAQPVIGTVNSNYPLSAIYAYLDGSQEPYGRWSAANNNTTQVSLRETDINYNLPFGSLSEGKHTIELIAHSFAHNEGVKFHSSVFYINVKTEEDTRPGKPTLNVSLDENYATFTWAATNNTTHYNLWLAKKNGDTEWEEIEQIFYAESGLSRTLEAGEYRAQLLSYNSNAWESDNSDWQHTWADDVFFTIEADTYTVTFDANGGAGAPASQTAQCGTMIALPNTVPERFGLNFMGWALTEDADIAYCQPGEYFQADSDTTLYAVWRAETLKGGVGFEGASQIVYPGTGYYYHFVPEYKGYWRIYSTGTDDYRVYVYDAYRELIASDDDSGGNRQFLLDYRYTDSVYIIYVEFYSSSATGEIPFTIAKGFNVFYNANGGEGGPNASLQYLNIDTTLSTNIPTRAGYTFLGWATSSTATSATYQPGDSFMPNADVTLYAVWKKGCDGSHSYISIVTKEGTCVSDGEITYVCEICGHQYTEAIAKLGHDYKATVTAPTCTAQGYTTYTCHRCGDSYKGDYTAATGHSFGQVTVHAPAPGVQGYSEHTCTSCGFHEKFDYVDFRGVSVSGTVTSYLTDGAVTVRLMQSGKAVYSTTLTGKNAAYTFDAVEPGTYTLEIRKADHITRSFRIVVSDANVVQDVEICPLGDVTGDGVVNIKDFQRLLRHVNKTNPLTGYELACGDVTGDGVCNIKDFQRLLRHVNKTNPLF